MNFQMVVGHLGRDPEIRYTPNQTPVTTISVATTKRYKDKSGVKQEKTNWHNVVFYNKAAETVAEFCKKGSLIGVAGRSETRNWEKDGRTIYATELIADSFEMYGGGRRAEMPAEPAEQKAHAASEPAEPAEQDEPI